MQPTPAPPTPAAAAPAPRKYGLALALAALPLLTALPLALFAGGLLWLLWSSATEEVEREQQQAVRALATAIDGELAASVRQLERVAEHPTLQARDLAAFYAYAQRLIGRREEWDNFALIDGQGQRWLNASVPLGAPLARLLRPHHRQALATNAPAVSDVFANSRDGVPTVAVAVPATVGGERWVLSARLVPARLSRLLESQVLRPDARMVVIDRNGLIVARSHDGQRLFGTPGTADFRQAAFSAPSGMTTIPGLEGGHFVVTWQRLASGWTAAMAVPVAVYRAPPARSLQLLAAAGLLVLLPAMWASHVLGRRIAAAIDRASGDAARLAAGQPVPARASQLAQIDSLYRSLADAGERLGAATATSAAALAAVRAGADRLRLAIEATGAGTFDWEPGGGSMRWDARAAALLGVDPARDRDLGAVLARVHPDDLPDVQAARQRCLEPAGDGRFRAAFRVRHGALDAAADPARGPWTWVDAFGQCFFDDGADAPRRPLRVVGLVLDIDAQRRVELALRDSEERLRLAIDATAMATVDWDLAADELRWSPRVFDLFGYPPATRPAVPLVLARMHPDDRGRMRAALAAALDPAGGGEYRVQYRVHPQPGRTLWVEARGRAFFRQAPGEPRVPVRFIAALIDVTASKELELALREADRRKDDFLAMLAHELRNPLAPLRNVVSILDQQLPAQGSERQALAIADRQLRHLTRLVDDLLDISRITRDKITLDRRPVLVDAIVQHAADSLRAACEARRLRLVLTQPPLPLRVLGDPVRLTQVLENLLANAVKFTAPGGRIEVEVEATELEIALHVHDTGVGIEPGQLDRVFEMFTQLDNALDRAQGGLGIGLALVRRLVEMHGGSVSARSAGRGRGASFTVRLPRLRGGAASDPPAAAGALPALALLVVDDNRDAAETLAALLGGRGHAVEIAYSGEEALARLLPPAGAPRPALPDAVLLDVGLPGVSGLEVARRLRADPVTQPLPLLAISGYGQDTDRLASTEAGFDAHLVKPVLPEELFAALAALLAPVERAA